MKDFLKRNKTIIILFCLAFVVRLIYVLLVKTPVVSDFETMLNASRELLNGTHEYKESQYFLFWAYQMGHVFYQYVLLSICNKITFLMIVNCLVTSLTVVFIYLISSKYTSKISSLIVTLIYTFFPFPLFMNSVLSNQQMPLLLFLVAIYLFINMNYDKYILRSIIIGLVLGISNVLRSETIVILFSLFLFSFFLIKKVPIKKLIVSFLLIFICSTLVFKGTAYAFKASGISTNGLDNKNSYWKFVSGFNYETGGVYSNDDAEKYANNKELAKEEAINRIKEFKKIPKLFLRKTKTMWFTSDLSWPIGHLSDTTFYKVSNIINQIIIIAFIALSVFSINNLFKLNRDYLLTFIICLVYFGVYLLIEVMPRYAYNTQVFLAILSSFGLDNIINYFKSKRIKG